MLLARDFLNCVEPINAHYSKVKGSHLANGVIHSYSEFYRVYHTIEHIEHGLGLLEEVRDLCLDYSLMVYAWWYHDYIYIPNTANNEDISADKAAFDAKLLGFSDDLITKIYGMILSTKHNKVHAISNDEQIIHDVDLAILGSDEAMYHRYMIQIEDEYSMFSKEEYNTGRLKVLEYFFNLENIYCTEYFRDNCQERARNNLVKEMEIIKKIM